MRVGKGTLPSPKERRTGGAVDDPETVGDGLEDVDGLVEFDGKSPFRIRPRSSGTVPKTRSPAQIERSELAVALCRS
jgi:hypothetical protein